MATIVVMAELMIETPMNEIAAITFLTRNEAPDANCVSLCVRAREHVTVTEIQLKAKGCWQQNLSQQVSYHRLKIQ